MKLPARVGEISLHCGPMAATYPPLGFVPFEEHSLGNGDYFGLYWPIGKEDEEPIVAEMWHDEWSVKPFYSSLDRFLELNGEGDPDADHPEAPSLKDDPKSPFARLEAARELFRRGDVEPAVRRLEEVISDISEYTAAWTLLCAAYRRLGDVEAAVAAALQALVSPPSFGPGVDSNLARWFVRQNKCREEDHDDPIWLGRVDLRLKFGGEKENPDYQILERSIALYVDRGDVVRAVTLMQTYGELMSAETHSFRERHGFEPRAHVESLVNLAESLLGNRRVMA